MFEMANFFHVKFIYVLNQYIEYLSFVVNVMEVPVNVSFLGYVRIIEIENLEEENPGTGVNCLCIKLG